jgi:MerR family transcriptional regulator, light-induced transcriptional regulator
MPESSTISHLEGIQFAEIAEAYLEALLAADRITAQHVITGALQDGLSIKNLYLGVFQPVQHEVGRLWLINRVSVTEEHFCTAATQTIMSDLYPQIISSVRLGRTLVAACIGAELHEIGVRMVADFFEMEGWDTYYIGAGISNNQILSALEQRQPEILALSATMTYHVPRVREIISIIREAYPTASPRIMVGGLPFNTSPDLWRSVGADVWAADAEMAVREAQQFDAIRRS